MDQPGIAFDQHAAALQGLRRLNEASRTASSLWRTIRSACPPPSGRPLRILDIASGGGDVALGLWRRAKRDGAPVEVRGLDFSPSAVEFAESQAPEGAPVRFSVLDVLGDALPAGYDVITSSLFLHHLSEEHASGLLRRMAEAAGQAFVVSDLRRCLAGYALAQLACRTLSRSAIVHTDGPRSVEGAFTIAEFRRLLIDAGIPSTQVKRVWPQRFLAVWRRDEQ